MTESSRHGLGAFARSPRVVLSVIVAVAVLAGFLTWSTVADRALDRVEVTWAEPLRCTGTEVVRVRTFGGARAPAMRMRESMRCTVVVRVANRGRRDVEVRRVVLPYMGPGGGAAVRVEKLLGLRPLGKASFRHGKTDAVFAQQRRLGAGERFTFAVRFTFRRQGCSSPGSSMTLEGVPRVVVSALGRERTRGGHRIGFVGTEDSSCDT